MVGGHDRRRVLCHTGAIVWVPPACAPRRLGGIAHERNGLEGEFAAREKLLPEPGRLCRQRERGQLAVVDVGLDGEEQVVASGVVPVFGGAPMTPIRPVISSSASRAQASAAWLFGLTNTTAGRVPWAR